MSKELSSKHERKAQARKEEAERLERASLLIRLPNLPPKTTLPTIPKPAKTQKEPAQKSTHTHARTEFEPPDWAKRVKNLEARVFTQEEWAVSRNSELAQANKNLDERLTTHVGWAFSKNSEQGLSTKHVEQRVNERVNTLLRNTESHISRVERKHEDHLQDYNRTEKKKQPLLTKYFDLQRDILEGVTNTHSNANNRLQKQFVCHTDLQTFVREQVKKCVDEALAENLRAPANLSIQGQTPNQAQKRPAPEGERGGSDSSNKSRRTTPASSRETTPEGTIRRRGGAK